MKIISVVLNLDKKDALLVFKKLIKKGKKYNLKFQLLPEIAEKINMSGYGTDEKSFYKKCDIVIVLGGDGTIISTANKFYKNKKPIVGIHLGSLGFLTEFKKDEIEFLVKYIASDDIIIEKRMMLETVIFRKGEKINSFVGMNESVISKSGFSQIINLKVFFDEQYVGTFRGDGILISTPTGSTAYSLAANGPIAVPLTELIIFNTICPHTFSTRPIVLNSDSQVQVEILQDKEILLTVDGHRGRHLEKNDIVIIRKSKYRLHLIRSPERNFFDILREKFQWIS